MKINKTTITLHLVVSGMLALLFATFFASGAIGENYTDSTFVAPIFFLIIVFWLLGFLFLMFRKYQTAIVMMWISIPSGMLIAFPVAAFL